jgi:hypothetical protein
MWQFDSSQSHHLPVFNWVHVQPQTSDFYLYLLVILSIPGIPTMKHFISWSRHHILGLFMLLISHQHHQHHTKSPWNHIKDISDLPCSMDPFVFFRPAASGVWISWSLETTPPLILRSMTRRLLAGFGRGHHGREIASPGENAGSSWC